MNSLKSTWRTRAAKYPSRATPLNIGASVAPAFDARGRHAAHPAALAQKWLFRRNGHLLQLIARSGQAYICQKELPMSLDAYLAAATEHEEAIAAVKKLETIISRGADAMKTWPKAHVDGLPNVGWPPDVIVSPFRIDAATWPTPQQIAEALTRYHSTRNSAQRAYDLVPEPQRKHLAFPRP
jgi:hypothetical protein